MHEMGIILHIAKMLDETAEEQHITKIGSVTLEVGEVSGIMTDLFVDCWNYFKVKHPVLAESELRLVTIPAVTYCSNCGKTYETVKYGKECPYCGSGETWHLQDDVLPCRDFVARIRKHPGGVAYGFCTKLFGDDISLGGLVYAQDAWHSFQCVCIPDRYARDFAAWFSRGDWKNSPNPELYTMQKLGKGDDSFFREYLLSEHGTEPVINYAPNLVEHIDWLIGGSSLGHWQRHMPRSARWEDEELVSELRERLRQRRPKP